jgi:hypothetical protein
MVTYTKAAALQFVEDAEDAGYEVEHYEGRAYWEGPSIEVDSLFELQRALAQISVPCQWDSMGKTGYVLYPHQHDAGRQDIDDAR